MSAPPIPASHRGRVLVARSIYENRPIEMGALRRLMLISGERATAKGVEITGECAEFDLVPAGADPPPLYNAVFENRSPLPPKIEFRRVQGG